MPEEPTARPPDFAIVGPPKTGTTALFTWLREHREVFLPEAKELHFFDQYRDRGLDWYMEQFAPAGQRVAGEATTSYFAHPTAVAELADLNPEIRLVVTLRDPVDRAWSQYNYGVARSWFVEPFAAMTTRELGAMLSGRQQPPGLLDQSRFGYHLERAAEHVPEERILALRSEDLESDPEGSFTTLCRFLGVDDRLRPRSLGSRENETRHVRYPRLFRAILLSRIDRLLGERARSRLAILLSSPGYPPLDPALCDALQSVFSDDQLVLERFLNADR